MPISDRGDIIKLTRMGSAMVRAEKLGVGINLILQHSSNIYFQTGMTLKVVMKKTEMNVLPVHFLHKSCPVE